VAVHSSIVEGRSLRSSTPCLS